MKKDSIQTFALPTFAIGISIFFTIFIWNIWFYGLNALGINFAIFWLLVLSFYILTQRHKLSKRSIGWIIPFVLIILSLGIYTAPFTSFISCSILPIIFFLFTTHESHPNIRPIIWSKMAPIVFGYSFISLVGSIFTSPTKQLVKSPHQKLNKSISSIILQIVTGLVFLFIISIVVIIPLLSSADDSFSKVFNNLLPWILDALAHLKSLPIRLLLISIISFILIGLAHYWNKTIKPFFRLSQSPVKSVTNSSIAIGIILSGILGLYLLFIGIQIHTLFTSQLPSNFKETENLVKSGFWQLLLLTIINTLFYIVVFRKSTMLVQRILSAFTLTSLLLIISAAHRVFMYVSIYGLSYEKFFALYTVIFCSIVFVWFLSLFTYPKHKPVMIVKILSFLALWMYALATITPLGQLILSTNLKLTQRENSRVNINELRMLGFDALPNIEKNFNLFITEARKDYPNKKNNYMSILEKENYTEYDRKKELDTNVNARWESWIKRNKEKRNVLQTRYFRSCEEVLSSKFTNCNCTETQENKHRDNKCKAFKYKKWYEKTFKELFYSSTNNIAFDNKKILIKEPDIKTFKDSIHGFSVKYSKDLNIITNRKYWSNSTNLDDMLKDDFVVTIQNKKDNKDFLKIKYFNLISTNPSDLNKYQRGKIKWIHDSKLPTTTLPNLPNTTVYAAMIYGMCDGRSSTRWTKSHRLYIIFPEKLLIICSSKETPKSTNYMDKFTSSGYIDLISPTKEFTDVINSFKLIDINKINKEI